MHAAWICDRHEKEQTWLHVWTHGRASEWTLQSRTPTEPGGPARPRQNSQEFCSRIQEQNADFRTVRGQHVPALHSRPTLQVTSALRVGNTQSDRAVEVSTTVQTTLPPTPGGMRSRTGAGLEPEKTQGRDFRDSKQTPA